ncbi:MAG: hypothetical protein ACOCQX_01755 [Candidatus Nanoarchaeia archaeon]
MGKSDEEKGANSYNDRDNLGKITKPTIVHAEDGKTYLIKPDPEGGKPTFEEIKSHEKRDLDKIGKYSRRAFVALGTLAALGAYKKWIWEPARYLGKATDLGLNVGESVKNLTKDTVNKITQRIGYETRLEAIQKEIDISDRLMEKFQEVYKDRHSLFETFRRAGNDLESMEVEVYEDLIDKDTYQKLKNSTTHKTHMEIYEIMRSSVEKIKGRKHIKDSEYIDAYLDLHKGKEDLLNVIRGLEEKLEDAYQNPDQEKLEKLMNDYIIAHAAQTKIRKKISEEGINEIISEEMKNIDSQLQEELGDNYQKYIEAYKDGFRFEKATPLAGAGIVSAGAMYIANKLGKSLEYIVNLGKSGQKISRRAFLTSWLKGLKKDSEGKYTNDYKRGGYEK